MTIVPLNDLKFEEIIGSGEFANVRKGQWKNHEVAIKQFKDTSSLVSNLLEEANIMR
jgi:predicted Ser/Thr protein kinase